MRRFPDRLFPCLIVSGLVGAFWAIEAQTTPIIGILGLCRGEKNLRATETSHCSLAACHHDQTKANHSASCRPSAHACVIPGVGRFPQEHPKENCRYKKQCSVIFTAIPRLPSSSASSRRTFPLIAAITPEPLINRTTKLICEETLSS